MIWWIVFGVIAIAYIAWIWWEFQHAIEDPPDWTGDSISRISQAIDINLDQDHALKGVI